MDKQPSHSPLKMGGPTFVNGRVVGILKVVHIRREKLQYSGVL